MMTRREKALDYFSRGYHCSQSVLAAYADLCSLSEQQALKLGACFGSGMRKGEVCGACSGSLMVLGSLTDGLTFPMKAACSWKKTFATG